MTDHCLISHHMVISAELNVMHRCIPENHSWDGPWSLSTNQPCLLRGTTRRQQAPTLLLQEEKAAHKRHTSSIPRYGHMFNHQLVPSPRGGGSFSIKVCLLNTTCGEGPVCDYKTARG